MGNIITVDINPLDRNQGFNIRAGLGHNEFKNIFSRMGKRITLSIDDLNNQNYIPRNDIDDISFQSRTVDGQNQATFNADSSSVAEAWYYPISTKLFTRVEIDFSFAVLFDLYRSDNNPMNQPLINFHGFAPHIIESRLDNTIIGHASTLYSNLSDVNTREIITISRGDPEGQTSYGFSLRIDDFNVWLDGTFSKPPHSSDIKTDFLRGYHRTDDNPPKLTTSDRFSIPKNYDTNISTGILIPTTDTYYRREISYNSGHKLVSPYLWFSTASKKFNSNTSENIDFNPLQIDEPGVNLVFDAINPLTTEISQGRCV